MGLVLVCSIHNPPERRNVYIYRDADQSFVCCFEVGDINRHGGRDTYHKFRRKVTGNEHEVISSLTQEILNISEGDISMPSFNKKSSKKSAPAKKAPAKKAPTKKASAKKAPAKKAPAKKAAPAKQKAEVELITLAMLIAQFEKAEMEMAALKTMLQQFEDQPLTDAEAEETDDETEETDEAEETDDETDEVDEETDDETDEVDEETDDDAPSFEKGMRVIAHYPEGEDEDGDTVEAADYAGEVVKIKKNGSVVVAFDDDGGEVEFEADELGMLEAVVEKKKSAPKKPAKSATKKTVASKPAEKSKEEEIEEVEEKIQKLLKKEDPDSACFKKGCRHFIKNKKCSLKKMKNCLAALEADD